MSLLLKPKNTSLRGYEVAEAILKTGLLRPFGLS